MTNQKSPEPIELQVVDKYGVDPEALSPYEREKLDLIQKSYDLLTNIKHFVVRGGLVGVFVFIIFAVSMSMIITGVSNNVDDNTQNIDKFGGAVVETRDTLKKALNQAQNGSDTQFTKDIKKGLDKIDKICEQTNCEGQ